MTPYPIAMTVSKGSTNQTEGLLKGGHEVDGVDLGGTKRRKEVNIVKIICIHV